MNRRRALAWAAALLALVAGLVALGHDWSPDDSLRRFQAGAPFRIGYAVEPPYAFLRNDGTVTGEAPEIARRIAERLGIRAIEWRQMDFAELLDALEAHRIDLIAAGMFITPEREARALFSLPTIHVRPGLLVARGNPRRIIAYQRAAGRAELTLAVLSGSVEEQIMRRLGVAEPRLLVVPDALSGRQAVESRLADALLLSEPTVRWMARNGQLGQTEMVVPPVEADQAYGATAFAFAPDARRLRDAWNAALGRYLGSPGHHRLLAGLGLADPAPSAPAPPAPAPAPSPPPQPDPPR